ncbi:hypothetical protein L208DRAFT_308386 [Tricholoma matsutake]|nr:hypothetical protein L208DRAFT_308386 [Tricholoma matsutake 945]
MTYLAIFLFGDICTANLTKADFIELQRQLQELNPDRNSEFYVAKDVLATKSAFLRSRSTALFGTNLGKGLVPRLVLDASQPPSPYVVEDGADDTDDADDAAAVADDAMDIDPNPGSSGCSHVNTDMADLSNEATAIFPYTIQYMDLTVLKLTTKDLRVPQLMLFRHEWASIIDIFNERKKGMRGSAVFTGQPSIGKTCLLYCILILCIVNTQSIMFQDMQGEVFVIDDTVHPPKDTLVALEDVDDVLTLVDADGASCQPNRYLFRDYKHRILLTSSPIGRADQRWLTQIVQDLDVVFVMEPWSREEIVVALLFLQSTDITLKRFQDTSHICGNIPRRCFEGAVSPDKLCNTARSIQFAIKQTDKFSDAVINVNCDGMIHRAFQICPSKDWFWNGCLIEPVSNWALLEMMAELGQ